MRKRNLLLITFCLMALIFNGCKKTPGQGGNASIKGKIWVKKYDPFFSILQYEYPGGDMPVEITFGNNTSPDMSQNTNSNGEFEFTYLRKGKYKITVYSKVLPSAQYPSGSFPVEATIEITSRKGTFDAGTLTIQR